MRGRGRLRVACLLTCAFVLSAVVAAGGRADPVAALNGLPAAGQGQPGPRLNADSPLDAVILLDESGSLDQAALDREKQAAALIAATDLGQDTRLAIVGFASAGELPAARTYCPLAPVDDQSAPDRLGSCLRAVKRRDKAAGNDTDYHAALAAAVDAFTAAGMPADPREQSDPRRRVIFLLTDGRPSIKGQDETGGAVDGAAQATFALIDADQGLRSRLQGVEIWPLALAVPGPAPAEEGPANAFLTQLAGKGAGKPAAYCPSTGMPASPPVIPWLRSAGDLGDGLMTTLTALRCVYPDPVATSRVAGDRVQVTIPAGVSDATITVLAPVGAPEPTFYLPGDDGAPGDRAAPSHGADDTGGTAYTSRRYAADRGVTVSSLRIVNPPPGTWAVSAEPGTPAGQLTVLAVWKVTAKLLLGMVAPAPGSSVQVGMSLLGRQDTFGDPRLMSNIQVSVVARVPRADGAADVVAGPLPLSDDVRRGAGLEWFGAPGDGVFAGLLPIPSTATGPIELAATVAGSSLGVPLCGTRRACAQVTAPSDGLTVGDAGGVEVARYPVAITGRVTSGEELSGRVVVTGSRSDRSPQISLALRRDQPADLDLRGDLGQSGNRTTFYTLTVGARVQPGPLRGTIRIYDTSTDPPSAITDIPINLSVVSPSAGGVRGSGGPALWLAVVLIGLVLLAALGAAVRSARRRRAPDEEETTAAGMVAYLWRNDSRLAHLAAPDEDARELAFTVNHELGVLVPAEARDADWVFRRRGGAIQGRRRGSTDWIKYDPDKDANAQFWTDRADIKITIRDMGVAEPPALRTSEDGATTGG
ncbi:VWA domain-containing protein [Frankia sp. CNm7]|uniref:VWA domain-containing protein n=1 Tax=Frankia nepalensis TaxID=1836974 RepID=A0A937RJH9_9ACTN|nr:vWA domain-containing protein [Frankia nepalensis]MBL7502085.1 VWA domain-containing protein [Frankia nepalensis]MBL7512682.1 VWA domain-containing protein [Frankia nepalensis]MBL7520852.1 VWA domain-containing protein [Frankia nepalensis]MBL7631327.1 VWA domain-containing protein [Frankia nepalensis]